ncbi:histidinol-phosphate transaminase [Terramyces sp. JEL0728]|nr:histidinol-phosphate transaminase [Terramyces sp. JEL0728]
MFDLKSIVRPNIYALKPYRCARDDYSAGILLDANENSHGSSLPQNSNFVDGNLERYPDPYQLEIKEKLCKLRGIQSAGHFFLGVGSDECIDMAIRVFVQPGKEKILITPPTYGMYSVSANINDVGIAKAPLIVDGGKFQLDVDNILKEIKQDPSIKLIFLCSPGNPTGTLLQKSDIIRILESSFKGIVFVDEAYVDFCADASCSTLVDSYPNLIVSQTLSKAFGLAGIRLGYTISSPEIAQIFNNTKAPYNISTLTSNIANQALGDGLTVMATYVASIKEQRKLLMQQLAKLSFVGGFLGTHDANFVLVQFVNKQGVPDNRVAMDIYKHLAEVSGVVVRFRGDELGCFGCLRITVGTPEENSTLIKFLQSKDIQSIANKH